MPVSIDKFGALTVSGSSPSDHIRFTPHPEISSKTFEITVSFGNRSVINYDLALFGIADFLTALRLFERTRLGRAVLDGTYEFRLTIEPNASGGAWLNIRIVDLFSLENLAQGRHVLEGGFLIDGEWIAKLVEAFSILLNSALTGQDIVHP